MKTLFSHLYNSVHQNLKPCKKYCRYVRTFTLGWDSNTETATKYSASPLQSHSSFHHLLVLFMQTAITSSPFKVEGPTTTKGQLISKCLFSVILSTKKPASWKLFGTSSRLPYKWHYLLSPYEAPKRFQEAPRKLQKNSGQKSLQCFRCYFGQNDDTKKTFRN